MKPENTKLMGKLIAGIIIHAEAIVFLREDKRGYHKAKLKKLIIEFKRLVTKDMVGKL